MTFASFSPAPQLTPFAGSLLAMAIAGFVGFEATVVLFESSSWSPPVVAARPQASALIRKRVWSTRQ
jgi:hypothetical protein